MKIPFDVPFSVLPCVAAVVLAAGAVADEVPAPAALPDGGVPAAVPIESAASGGFRFRLSAGPAWNRGSRLEGRWNPDAVRRMLSVTWGGSSSRNSVPSSTGYADRDYVDGYVHLDEGTTDPGTMEYGLTWNWGYDAASQYDGSTVAFHTGPAGATTSVNPVDAPSATDREDVDFSGADVLARLSVGEAFGATAGVAAGLRWFDSEDVSFDRSAAIVRESRSSWRYVDLYDAHWDGFPAAPYANDVDGPGYLLDNQPMSRSVQSAGGSSSTWSARSRTRAEIDRLDLRLGLSLEWDLASWLGFGLQPQLLVSRVELSADVETTVVAGSAVKLRRVDRAEKDAWIAGAGAEGSLVASLGRGWSLSVSGAWDGWFDDLSVGAGPCDLKAELGEWTVSLALGKEF